MHSCSKCRQEKSLSDFPPSKAKEKGQWCRSCLREQKCGPPTQRACDWCGAVLVVTARRAAEPRVFCSKSCKDKARLGLLTPAERYLHYRRSNLKKLYGISLEQYDELYEQQEGRCAICRGAHEVLVVDHDHETGEIRGLLCHNCNRSLGLMGEDPAVLRAAADYLED